MFYVPHWIWKNWEEEKMQMITDGLRGVLLLPNTDRQESLVLYLVYSFGSHDSYAWRYFLCEFLNVVNIVSINIQ